ncbi:hypothetical protein JOE25_004270 [Serratia sp. PL17]|uniref:hypothetical protein n=1 Tax=Serratia sp. PL17 TaxID=2806582 RepID=UPI001AEAC065|nr:hypothetical protein [Serratia sp. PL17]MBP1132664.1 hypothetical protein [Serratia sp. PL17]
MTKTLTTDRLKQITDAISAEPHDYESIYDSIKHGEIAAMARELLANREAQPVGFYTTVSGRKGVVWHNGAPEDDTAIYTAPPAPAVPDEKAITPFFDTIALDTAKMVMCDVNRRSDFLGGDIQLLARIQCRVDDACRAAMLAQPVSQGCELPDNVREALTLALQAMEFMGDTLNNIDAVCTEDVEYVTPAFTAVRGLLAAAPEGGN